MKQTRKRRILIVDDSKMNREILTGILEDEYDIVEAEDGKKAIEIMEEGLYSFSIVLLDITMPELDGFGVLQVMQQRNWLKELPVIIISAETSNEYIGHAYEMGSVIISADLLMQGLLTPECATRSHFLNEIILIR